MSSRGLDEDIVPILWFEKPQRAVKSKSRMESCSQKVYERVQQSGAFDCWLSQQTAKLVKLNVFWNTDHKSDKNALVRIVQSNNALKEIKFDADVNNNVTLPFEFVSKILEVLKPHKEFNRHPPRTGKLFRSLYLIPDPSPYLQVTSWMDR